MHDRDSTFSLTQYQRHEARILLIPLAVLGLGLLLQIPRDLAFTIPPAVFAATTGLRLSAALLFTLLPFLAEPTASGRRYLLLLVAGLVLAFLGGVLALISRPQSELFDFLLALVAVAYFYFLLPAPVLLKVVTSGLYTIASLWSVYFWKTYTPEQAFVVSTSFLLVNLMGIIAAILLGNLRRNDARLRARITSEMRLKTALADQFGEAILIHDEGLILDFNQAFCDLAERTPGQLRGSRLEGVLQVESGNRTTFEAHLRGPGILVPVEIQSRPIVLDGLSLTCYLVHDVRESEITALRHYRSDLDERIAALPISAREKDIVARIISGQTRFQIAEELFISDETVKKHTANLYRKLNLNSKVDLLRLVMENL